MADHAPQAATICPKEVSQPVAGDDSGGGRAVYNLAGQGCRRFGIKEQGVRWMRLDKYLQVSRLIKRRAGANEACDAGRVKVNGRVAKAGLEVRPGDIVELSWGNRVIRVEVLVVPERAVAAAQARSLYRTLEEATAPAGETDL